MPNPHPPVDDQFFVMRLRLSAVEVVWTNASTVKSPVPVLRPALFAICALDVPPTRFNAHPGRPAGTRPSQYCAMVKSDHLSASVGSTYLPRPWRVLVPMSYQHHAGLFVQPTTKVPSQLPVYLRVIGS